jgi:hypothetical protein
MAYLERMQPKAQFVKRFTEIVWDVWREKQAQNLLLTVSLKPRIEVERGEFRTGATGPRFNVLDKPEGEKSINGDPTGNRTRATSVKGRCPNR